MTQNNLTDDFSEREIISGILNTHDSFTNIYDILTPDHFHNPECAAIYRAFVETYQKDQPADVVTLANKAGVKPSMIVSIMGDLCMGVQRRTAERIVQLSQKRSLLRSLKRIASEIEQLSVEDLAGKLTETAVAMSLDTGRKRVLSAGELITRVDELQRDRQKQPDLVRGIHTGYQCLDMTLRGLRPRRMTLLVAATGFGKSTLTVNIFNNAVQAGTKSLLISTENDVDDNLDRLAGIVTGLDLKDVESGHSASHVTESFSRQFQGRTCFVSDNSPRNIHEVIGTIARYVLQHGVELVFVDYIGEIALDGVRNENEEARLTRYSQALIEAARTLNCHIVCLAQLNRDGNRKGRPGKTELQGCFKMAQKAHSLLIFWRTEDGQDVVTVDKNRQGPGNKDIAVKFDRYTQRIVEKGFYVEAEKKIIPIGSQAVNHDRFVDLD